MDRRFLCPLLALSISAILPACSGEDEGPTQTPTLEVSGVYRAADHGAIEAITFSGNKDYLLMPEGCVGECAERGTYRLDGANHVLVLEDASSHQTRSLALEIVETTPVGRALAKSLRPLDLVEPGGETTKEQQQLTVSEQQRLMERASQLSGTISLLLRIELNGQSLIRNER